MLCALCGIFLKLSHGTPLYRSCRRFLYGTDISITPENFNHQNCKKRCVYRLPELRLCMTHSQKLTAKTKPRLRIKMESINTKLHTILGQLFSFNSSEWFFLGTSILGLLKPLKEHPHRPRKMAAKNGWYFTRKKCTWYHIF